MEQQNSRHKNIIGPQIRRIRAAKNLSQSALVEKLQRAGWDLSRGELAKIEAQVAYIREYRLCYLARVLGVPRDDFFPPMDEQEEVDLTMDNLLTKKQRLSLKKTGAK